ncbi:hypothetical protein ABIC02_007661 [Bradyrhizobium sp. RT5a]
MSFGDVTGRRSTFVPSGTNAAGKDSTQAEG